MGSRWDNWPVPEEKQANDLLQQGIQCSEAGDVDRALQSLHEALALAPDHPVVHYNRGLVLQKVGRLEEALVDYRAATNSDPALTSAWVNQAFALIALGRYPQAIEAADWAIQQQNSEPSAWLAKGNALKGIHALGQAAEAFRQGVQLALEAKELKASLANTLRELGQVEESIVLLRETVVQFPDFAEAQRDLAHALLLNGEYLEGWKQNRWRWKTQSLAGGQRHQSIPEWTGQTLTGKRILLWDEQGFGDAIQFVRFVPWVAELGAEVVLEVQSGLVRLFQTVRGVTTVAARGEELPAVDYQVSLLDLGDVFKTDSFAIPNEVPYLEVLAEETKGEGLRVGICWAGNPMHDNDRNRSLNPELLQPVFSSEGIECHSLQVGVREVEAEGISGLTPLSFSPTDFFDTAKLIASMDVVISVDSAIAHLAGALGKEVWILLPFAPDWRWMLSGEDSLWYPSATLIRQNRAGNWGDPITKILQKLAVRLSESELSG